jgi:hypothetical protein
VPQASVSIFVDYESPLARRVAADVWSGLSRTALDRGYLKTSAHWESLESARSLQKLADQPVNLIVLGQDRPDAVDAVGSLRALRALRDDPALSRLYGLVVAVPERPSPLAGSLLYQGVRRLTAGGVRAGMVEPALLRGLPGECERYARRLLARLEGVWRTA